MRMSARYEILERLGAGAMAEVFAARERQGGQPLALKILREEHRLRADLLTRFVNEALPIRDVQHPGLPRIHACEVPGDDPPYIAMERLGEALSGRIARGRLPLCVSLDLGAQIAAALAAVHARGIVHRDVKPHNILFAGDAPQQAPRVKLVDFGLAKWPGVGQGAAPALPALPISTAGDDRLGTPEYMAPEQALSAKTVSGSADVYALGVVLYELCAGARPFAAGSDGRLRLLHLMAPPPPLLGDHLPAGLWPLLAAMLDKDRARRPSALEVCATLSALCG